MLENSTQVNTEAEIKPEDTKKSKKIPKPQIYETIIAVMNNELFACPAKVRACAERNPFPYKITVYQKNKDKGLKIIKTDASNNCEYIDERCLKHIVMEYTQRTFHDYIVKEAQVTADEPSVAPYRLDIGNAIGVVETFIASTVNNRVTELPKTLGWLSDPEPVLRRLPFDPIDGIDDERLGIEAPTFAEILSRMENSVWFMWRVGSLLDPLCDRKQAAYVWGPADCGKSQIQDFLAYVCGTTYATTTTSAIQKQFGMEDLVGKRVCAISESSSSFFGTDHFKSLTGDNYHSIDGKYEKKVLYRIDAVVFSFSNEPPCVESKPELRLRISSCKMEALNISEDQRMKTSDYQEKLRQEAQAFLSACWTAYKNHKQSRMQFDTKTLDKAIDDKEEWALSIIEDCFEIAPGNKVSARDLRNCLTLFAKEPHKCDQIIRIIMRRFGVEKKLVKVRGKPIKTYIGIRIARRDFKPLDDYPAVHITD